MSSGGGPASPDSHFANDRAVTRWSAMISTSLARVMPAYARAARSRAAPSSPSVPERRRADLVCPSCIAYILIRSARLGVVPSLALVPPAYPGGVPDSTEHVK